MYVFLRGGCINRVMTVTPALAIAASMCRSKGRFFFEGTVENGCRPFEGPPSLSKGGRPCMRASSIRGFASTSKSSAKAQNRKEGKTQSDGILT